MEKSETALLTRKFLIKLRERENNRVNGGLIRSDSLLLEEFYKTLIGKEGEKIFKDHKYVTNRYFIDNHDKYTDKNNDNKMVLFQDDGLSTEDRLKLPILDCFVSRYVYYSFIRWSTRVGQFIGVVKE